MDQQFKRLVTMFGMPNKPDPKAFLDEFVKAVGTTWPDGVLERAVSRLIAEHSEPFWPMPAKLKKLCYAECPAPKPLDNGNSDPRPVLTDEQVAEQERVMRDHKRRMREMKLDDDWDSLPDVSRETFEMVQVSSPNRHLHWRDV